jgi:hypothetical protein
MLIVSDWGNKVNSLWHRVVVPASQSMQPGGPVRQPFVRVDFIRLVRYNNPMPGLTLSPQSGTMNLATAY